MAVLHQPYFLQIVYVVWDEAWCDLSVLVYNYYNTTMGQNICEQAPHSPDIAAQQQHEAEIQPIPKTIHVEPPPNMLTDEPHVLFATRLENTNFLLPAHVEQRLTELKPFIYPDGPDVPKGTTLLYPYLLQNGAIYAGDWKGGKMHGKGFFVLPDKSLLTCTMNENVISRKSRIIYPNGDYYEGEVSNNRAQGKGKLVEGKVTYIGEFKDNRPHGKGQQIGQGYSFEGQYEAGEKKNGTLTWKKDGQTFTYKGSFKNNLFDGRGNLLTKEGRYVGSFQKGEKSGVGKFYYPNNRYYQGEFRNDRRHGQGKIIDEQKSVIVCRGEWKDDIFVE